MLRSRSTADAAVNVSSLVALLHSRLVTSGVKTLTSHGP